MAKAKSSVSINFYIKNYNRPTYPIFLQFCFKGDKLKYYLKESVAKEYWNSKKQRVKDNQAKTADGQFNLNDFLDALAKEVGDAYEKELKNGTPTKAMLKKHLDEFVNRNHHSEKLEATKPTLFKLIDRFIAGEIKYRGKDKSPNTIKTYATTKGHLLAFEKKEAYPVNFDSIDLDFYYKFTSYLKKEGLEVNSIGKNIQVLKVFMGEAVDLGYTENIKFKHKKFAIVREETDAVYLTESEINKLFRFDLSENKRLEQVRDLFVFGCHVGLRLSDYSNVKPENIQEIDGELFVRMITKKTGNLVIIPCNPIVKEIFSKYEKNPNKLPKTISDVKFNKYIKEACKEAGFNEKGRLADKLDFELHQCVSSHTARRSFATNYYLDNFPTIDLMKITGHKTERAFMKYIKITKLDSAKRMQAHINKKNWSKFLLKAVA